jgi:hypothetical protein
MTTNSLALHITSFLTGVVGIIALVHPGFKEPTYVVGLVPVVAAFIVGGLQLFKELSKNTLAANLALIEAQVLKLSTPVAPVVVPVVAPVAVPASMPYSLVESAAPVNEHAVNNKSVL